MEVEKWDWKDWRNWVAIATWVLLPLFIFLGLVPGWSATTDWFLNKSGNVASWFQALGSIAAIVAGGIGLRWQMREGQRQQLQNEVRLETRQLKSQYGFLAYRCADIVFWAQTIKELDVRNKEFLKLLSVEGYEKISAINSIEGSGYPEPSAIGEMDRIKQRLKSVVLLLSSDLCETDPVHWDNALGKALEVLIQVGSQVRGRFLELSLKGHVD